MQTALLGAAVVGVLALSIAVVWRVERPEGRWRRLLTDRFIYGIPWGTIVTVAFVLAIYLFVQGAWRDVSDPVVLPFRAWSYLYPTGMLTAGFAHASEGHVTSNLIGTLVLAPIAEYAWSHYPPDRRSGRSLAEYPMGDALAGSALATRADDWRSTTWIRAVVIFPGVVIAVGLFTAAFAIGPVIGFSGVVFAFGGFALVHYPITTLLGLLMTGVVRTFYSALTDPIVRAGASGSAPRPPGWATVAVQGHAIGIMIGIVLGLALLWHRGRRPPAGRIFLATLVYGINRSLWAVYWFEGDGIYVLFRGLGVTLVTLLALIVVVAAASADRSVPRLSEIAPRRLSAHHLVPTARQFASGALLLAFVGIAGVVVPAAIEAGGIPLFAIGDVILIGLFAALAIAVSGWLAPVSAPPAPRPNQRRVAFGVLLVATAAIAGPAIVPNLATVGDDAVPGEGHVTVEDYTVTYEENTRDRMIPAIDLPGLAEATQVRTSGVIVVSEDRHIWTRSVSRQFLASEGQARVTIGGVGWRETVRADRNGYAVVGNDSVYAIDLRADEDDEWTRSFASEESIAQPRIANRTVAVVAEDDEFVLRVSYGNETVGTTPIPGVGEETSVGGLDIAVEDDDGRETIYAERDGTRVRIAAEELYRQR